MADIDLLGRQFEDRIGCPAPPTYIERISSLASSIVVSHPALPNRSWRFFDQGDLNTEIRIDHHEGARWEAVALFGEALVNVGITKLNGPGGRSPEFLKPTVSIAHDNGDFLFLRPDASVWIFHHDGHEIQRVSSAFRVFDREALWPRHTELEGTELNKWETLLVGRWVPVSSDTETDSEFFELTKHEAILNKDRTATLVFSDETSDEHWHADERHFAFTLQGHEVSHTYRLDRNVLDITTKFGDHTRYERENV